MLIPVKAKTKHIISEKDFVRVLPVVSVLWKRAKKESVYFFSKGLWAGRKVSCNFPLNMA